MGLYCRHKFVGGGTGLDWKVMLSTFGLIFLAELGDKTQLTTMMLAAQSDSATAVFVGAAVAASIYLAITAAAPQSVVAADAGGT